MKQGLAGLTVYLIVLILFWCVCSGCGGAATDYEIDYDSPVAQLAMSDFRREYTSNYSEYGAVFGLCCGVFGIPMTIATRPTVPAYKLMGRSPVYVATYAKVYSDQQYKSEIEASVAGCCVHNIGLGIIAWAIYLNSL